MRYKRLYAYASPAEYAWPGRALDPLVPACADSAFQLLDKTPLDVEIAREGGVEFADFFVYKNRVPLVSERLRQALDDLKVDNLFYKRVTLVCVPLGLKEPCWLALPPRIDCLDWQRSVFTVSSQPGDPFWAAVCTVTTPVIDPRSVGRYRMFKMPPPVLNPDIIVTEELAEALESRPINGGRPFANLHFESL